MKDTLLKDWRFQVFLMEIRKLMTYRVDFWVNFFGQSIFSLIVAYFLWSSIFESSKSITLKGYNIQGMIFYYLIVPLIFRVQQGEGVGFMSREIYDGGLSKYLLYPINYFQYKKMIYFANSTFFLMQLFFILFSYHLIFHSPQIYTFSFLNLGMFLLIIFIASLTFFYLHSLIELAAFWFDNIWSLGVILRFATSFFGGALIPLSFFPEWAQRLVQLTPFPYLIDFPMKALTKGVEPSEFFFKISIILLWLCLFKIMAYFIWKKGQLHYTGVGI